MAMGPRAPFGWFRDGDTPGSPRLVKSWLVWAALGVVVLFVIWSWMS